MIIADVCTHIHNIRNAKSGVSPGKRLRWFELSDAVKNCTLNGVSSIECHIDSLPDKVVGVFMRIGSRGSLSGHNVQIMMSDRHSEIGHEIFCKEAMHCWSDSRFWVTTPEKASSVLSSLMKSSLESTEYAHLANADQIALLASINVQLPYSTIISEISKGRTIDDIGHDYDFPRAFVEILADPQIIDFLNRYHL